MLMDLNMPEMNDIDALIAIRNEFPDAKVIVLTTYVGDAQILRALKAGAQAYPLKNTLHKELVETIRAVHAGKKALSPEASFQVAEHATDDALTPAEILVLKMIAAGMQISRLRISSQSRRKPLKVESRTFFLN